MAISEEERARRKEERRKKREAKKAETKGDKKEKENRKEEPKEKKDEKGSDFPPKNCDKPRDRKVVVVPIGMASQMVNLDLVADIHGRMTAGIGLEKRGRMISRKKVTLQEARRQLSAIQGKYKKISGLKKIPEFFEKDK